MLRKGQRLKLLSTENIFSNEIKVGDTCIVIDIKKKFVLLFFERTAYFQLDKITSTSHLNYEDIPHTDDTLKLYKSIATEGNTIHSLSI